MGVGLVRRGLVLLVGELWTFLFLSIGVLKGVSANELL